MNSRHGASASFAGLNVATGQRTAGYYTRRRREFLDFMNDVVAVYPDRGFHVVLDNVNTHEPSCSGRFRSPDQVLMSVGNQAPHEVMARLDGDEDRLYRQYLEEQHHRYRTFARMNRKQQLEYWRWRHEHERR